MQSGYIKFYRKIMDSNLWLDETFTRGQAWADMIMLASYCDGYVRISGRRIEVKRGQLAWSVQRLSRRWKWSDGKTDRFLNELSNDGMIVHQNAVVTSLISIINYDQYQSNEAPDRAPDEAHSKNWKEGKEGKEDPEPPIAPLPGGGSGKGPASPSSHAPAPAEKSEDEARRKDVAHRLNELYRRRESTRWSDREVRAMRKIWPVSEDDLRLIEAYYTAAISPDKDIRRRDLLTLLNNWPGEVDRARNYLSRAESASSAPSRGANTLSTWEIKTRLQACRDELQALQYPGGCAYPVDLEGTARERADRLRATIKSLKAQLTSDTSREDIND